MRHHKLQFSFCGRNTVATYNIVNSAVNSMCQLQWQQMTPDKAVQHRPVPSGGMHCMNATLQDEMDIKCCTMSVPLRCSTPLTRLSNDHKTSQSTTLTTGSLTIHSRPIMLVPCRRFSSIVISRFIFFFFTGCNTQRTSQFYSNSTWPVTVITGQLVIRE